MHLCRSSVVVPLFLLALSAAHVRAADHLCDPSFQNCRTPLLDLIHAETVGIDVAFWFMEDTRYSTALIERWKAGVPVRVIMDTRANKNYPTNAMILQQLTDAGIPMLEKTSTGIVHWKSLIFAGQNVVEFSGANFSPHAFVPTEPYVNYLDEVIYFTDDPAWVNSFKTKYDDVWISTSGFTPYANLTGTRTRRYPVFPIHAELNFVPFQNFATRSVPRYDAETVAIDSIMFRTTDRRHTDALIRAKARGVPVRLIVDEDEYRDPNFFWNAYNIDVVYAAGIPVRMEGHLGSLHQKSTLLRGQQMTIFGSSNWTTASASRQLEHNIFTKKPHVYQMFSDQFERKWSNLTGHTETKPFVPKPPDPPVYVQPANAATGQALTVTLTWYAGVWAHKYDIYFGTTADPPLLEGGVELGPSTSRSDYVSYSVTGLSEGTTYYWKVVSKTMANVERSGAIWNFRTIGLAPNAGTGDVVLYAARAATRTGRWSVIADPTAAGGSRIATTDAGVKLAAQASPSDYFEMTFTAESGVPYHLWVRGKAQSNQWSNDSASVQFNDSMTSSGTAIYRIGTSSAATVTIEDCSGCGLSGWGWNDNAFGAVASNIYFASTGQHHIRVQMREDGLSIDQIVLSRGPYLSTPPGATKNDGTILAPAGGSDGETPPVGDDPDPAATDVVMHAASARLAGSWTRASDATAASGAAVVLPDAGRAKVITPVANPAHYFELTFHAYANTPYHLWVRGRALNDSPVNDSVHVQFTDSVDANYNAAWRIGSTSGLAVNLEDCSGCGNAGWGWEDNGWGTVTTLGAEVRFPTTGTRVIRIQNREDGFFIDQIVLSPGRYLDGAPGANKNDGTILPASP